MPNLRSFALLLAVLGCADDKLDLGGVTNPGPVVRPTLPQTFNPSGEGNNGRVAVQLFEWSWQDVATECENHLGPMGYYAALVSPPQEHIQGLQWWTRYQAVSYSIDQSRSGTRAQFVDMVARCQAAGVRIYVDAVVNHMTGTNGTGTNGTVFTKYEYPGLYTRADFHSSCGIADWNNPTQVWDCELVGLADLNTVSASVQQKIASFLIELSNLGVAGYRIDAAKHIHPVELDSIVSRVNRAMVAAGKPRPYWFLEVIDYGGEAVRVSDYYGIGYASGGTSDITEFKARGLADKFLGKDGQKVAELATFSQANWGLMPSSKALVFVNNHDTQRGDGILWSEGNSARLANVFLLAQPYGYPMIMSGYSFDRASGAGRDGGPPAGAGGAPGGPACASDPATAPNGVWLCEHRDPWLRAMLRFRAAVAGQAQQATWNNGTEAVAFSRGALGFVAINDGAGEVVATIPTSLPAGVYCDLLTGGKVGGSCAGTTVTVDAGGAAAVTLPSRSAVVLLVGDTQ